MQNTKTSRVYTHPCNHPSCTQTRCLSPGCVWPAYRTPSLNTRCPMTRSPAGEGLLICSVWWRWSLLCSRSPKATSRPTTLQHLHIFQHWLRIKGHQGDLQMVNKRLSDALCCFIAVKRCLCNISTFPLHFFAQPFLLFGGGFPLLFALRCLPELKFRSHICWFPGTDLEN